MGLGLYIQYFRLYAKKKKVTKNEQIIKNLVNRNINVKYSKRITNGFYKVCTCSITTAKNSEEIRSTLAVL